LLNYLKSRGIIISILVLGISRENCTDICDELAHIVSDGCTRKDGNPGGCDDVSLLNCTGLVEGCHVTWTLPSTIDLLPVSSFTFSLGNAYVQELLIRIDLNAEPSPAIPNLDLSVNTAKISAAYIQVPLRLSNPNYLIFDITRQYELDYVLQTSESIILQSDGTPSNDWKMTAVFLPLQDTNLDVSVSDQNYFGSSVANQITIQLQQPNFYIANSEGRIYQSGALFLTLVNVLAGILGIFQLFSTIISKATAVGRDAVEGNLVKTREEHDNGDLIKSPRYDRTPYNPYDIKSIMDAFIENDFAQRLKERKKNKHLEVADE